MERRFCAFCVFWRPAPISLFHIHYSQFVFCSALTPPSSLPPSPHHAERNALPWESTHVIAFVRFLCGRGDTPCPCHVRGAASPASRLQPVAQFSQRVLRRAIRFPWSGRDLHAGCDISHAAGRTSAQSPPFRFPHGLVRSIGRGDLLFVSVRRLSHRLVSAGWKPPGLYKVGYRPPGIVGSVISVTDCAAFDTGRRL